MASRTKKVAAIAGDTVTFTKAELVSKVKKFLEDEGACDGDWLNKVKVEFLGQKLGMVHLQLRVAAELSLEMATDGVPSKEEVLAFIRSEMDEGNLDESSFDYDCNDIVVEKITKA